MKTALPKPLPGSRNRMREFGSRLKMARLRRQLPVETVCARMPCSRPTWQRIESGDPTVSMGRYFRALEILGMAEDIERLGADDVLGKRLQDIAVKKRAHAQRAPRSPPNIISS